jgi:phage shock protein E
MSALLDKVKAGAKIVDVRSADEFEGGHFPEAVNISVEQVHARLAEFGDKNAPVIVYCATGSRSAYAARLLKMAGYTMVINAGGLDDMPRY